MSEKLKVGDLVQLKKETYDDMQVVIEKLSELVKEYTLMVDDYNPHMLEEIKKQFLGYLYQFTFLFAKIKCFKSANHSYLEDARKKVKAETIKILIDEGNKITQSENLVYAHPYYAERVGLMESIKEFMIRCDLLNDLYQSTFQSIVQSLSAARKEMDNTLKHG